MAGVLFRADGSPEIGLGHLVRCRALAEAIETAGGQAAFVSVDPSGLAAAVLQDRLAVALPEGLTEDEDAAATRRAAEERGVEWIVVDHYGLGAEWWRAVGGAFRVAALDDEGRPGLGDAVDLVLNQNAGAREDWYPGRAALRIGPRYALLRREILDRAEVRETRRTPRSRVERVVVTLGGGAAGDTTAIVLEALGRLPGPFETEVVAGVSPRGDPSGLRSPSEMAELLSRADLAITGGGSTLYEAAFLGLPAAAVVMAPNQAPIAAALARLGSALDLGPAAGLDPGAMAAALAPLFAAAEARAAMSRAGMELVDGRGAERVAADLLGRPGPSPG